MDFALTFEMKALGETLARYAAEQRERNRERNVGASDSELAWSRFSELGWLTIPFPETVGGSGMGVIGSMLVCEHLGSALVDVPYLSRVVAAGSILAGCSSESGRLAALMAGQSRITAGLQESRDYDILKPTTRANRKTNGYRLNGTKIHVLGLQTDGELLVNAVIDGEDEPGLFLVETNLPGITVESYGLPDDRSAVSVRFLDADLSLQSRIDKGNARILLETVYRNMLIAAASDNLGAMQLLYDTTLDYAKTRQQFGRRIGNFQYIQFRLVDLWVKLDEARSLITAAALASSEDHAEAAKLATHAWIQSLWSGKLIGEDAVQIHGAVGMTDACSVGRFFKRILVNEFLFGSADYHLLRDDLRVVNDYGAS